MPLTWLILQSLITELVKGLGSLMRRRDPKSHKSEDDPGDVYDAMASILTPFDETQYWYSHHLNNALVRYSDQGHVNYPLMICYLNGYLHI